MLVCIIFISTSFKNAFAQTDQEQRIHAAYILSFGRDASGGEVDYWKKQGNLTIGQLINKNQQYLLKDITTHNTTIDRAYQDALGRNATQSELAYWKKGNDTYFTLVTKHINWLKGNPAEYEKVIKNSYQYVFGRQPNSGEINFWKGQGVVSYLLLVGYHQDWKRKNPAKPMESGNTVDLKNFPNIITTSLSVNLANEAKAGLVASGGGNLVASGGGNLVASGGGNLVGAGAQ